MSDTTATPTTDDDIDITKLDKKLVAQIVQWETEADSLTGEADTFRAQAAGHIVKLLDKGATERQVAKAIGKGAAHVHFASVAWRSLQGDTGINDFQTAYKLAKRPAPERAADPDGTKTDGEEATNPFPSWTKQVRELKRLSAEMIDQATLKQTGQLSNILEKALRATLSKQQELDKVPGAPDES